MSTRDIDSDEDPLVELARIVSEDGAFGMGKPEKPKVVPRAAPKARPSLEDGLEAELLQELESSFAVRETPVPPPPRPTPVRLTPSPPRAQVVAPKPVNPDPDPDELLRSIEEQLGQFERRHAGRFSPPPANIAPEPPVAEEAAPVWDEPVEEERPASVFGAPSAESRRGSRIRPFAESAEPLADEILEPEELPSLSVARADYRFRGPASANWDPPQPRAEDADEAVREAFQEVEPSPQASLDADDLFTQADAEAALAKAEAAVALERAAEERTREEQRRDRITATFPEFEEEPIAVRAQPDLAGLEAGLSRELEPEYADPIPAGKFSDGDAPVEESRVAAAIAPGPSRRAAAARAAEQRGRSRMGLLTAAGVILVVLIGAGAALYLRTSEESASGPPPVIAADDGAVRVEPSADQAATDGETVGDAVYNRVAGTTPETEEQVVESAEEPKEVARIVLPPTQTPDEQAAAPVAEEAAGGPAETAASADPNAGDEIGPRRVPTFVIRADGSIVETSAAAPPQPNPTAAQNEQLSSETIEPTPVPTVAIAEAPASGEGLPAPTPPAETTAPEAVDLTPRPSIEEQPAEVAAVEPPAVVEEPAPADAAIDEGTLANAAPAATPAPDAASGGYVVQLSAERSMEQAQTAYAAAQGKYPSVLGELPLQVQEADLGAKGIYFRVRVGPWASREEAIGVCESLKAAGGDCFVTQ